LGIEQYQMVAALDSKSQNIQFLEKLVRCMVLWRDTSIKKVHRVEELNKAAQICELFVVHMDNSIPAVEQQIYLSIFSGISRDIVSALSGQTVNFEPAIGAVQFILTNLKETNRAFNQFKPTSQPASQPA